MKFKRKGYYHLYARTLLLMLFFPLTSFAGQISITYEGLEATIKYTFDPERISPELLNKYLVIHPSQYRWEYFMSHLELCIQNNPEYLPCGSRDIEDQNFMKNASINFRKSEKNLEYLLNLKEIKQLSPLVDYFKESLSFSLWKDKKLLEFYKSWDTKILRGKYKKLDPAKMAPEIFNLIDQSKTKKEKYKIAHNNWANGMNHIFREKLGDPPVYVWKQFLSDYGIKEDIISEAD
jgi:hypothetical protein